jgi:putative membrane protein
MTRCLQASLAEMAGHRAMLCSAAMKLLAKWLLSASALLALAHLYSGVELQSFSAALLAALVIGLFNIFLRPLLILLTLPVTVLSLGLFLFVINALLFWAAATVLDGFQVRDFAAALLGSLLYSIFSLVIDSALERLFPQH